MYRMMILCDFDGTIVEFDTVEYILDELVPHSWRIFDEQLERGEITLAECMRKEVAMIKKTRDETIDLVKDVKIRSGFKDFVDYCRLNDIPISIVSAGLDFVIKHILRINNIADIPIHAPVARCYGKRGIVLSFKHLPGNGDFKEGIVENFKEIAMNVSYIGDGIGDYNAAKTADFVFAIKGGKLASFCKKEGLNHIEVNDFDDVISYLIESNIEY
ncbi:MAG: MtnX-like HAD-IB family phosphatase [Candidatus Hodarchaeota archaeon]